MKKIVSVLLATIMLTMCLGTTGFAADVSFSDTTMEDIIDMLDRNMPETQARRVEVFRLLALYMSTDDNMDALIEMVETLTVPGDRPETFEQIITALGTELTENQDTVLFILDFLRALPAEKRAAALAAFEDAQQAVDDASTGAWVSEAEAGVVLESVDQAALRRVYDSLVNNDVGSPAPGDAQLATHGVGINTILRLSFAFQDSLVLTDASDGSADFAVKTISTDFKNGLYTYVTDHFDAINGDTITDGDVVINALVEALNAFDASLKADIKTVLGASEIALYAPLAVDDDDDDDSSNRPSSRPSDTKPDITQQIGKLEPNKTEVTQPPVAEAAYVYTDTTEHWAKDYIAELSKRGIFNGYEDGSFRPDLGITREEIAVAMTRALGLETKAKRAPYANFEDSSYISEWAIDAVNLMVKEGIFTGYDDGLYRPQQIITREQLVAVVMRMFSSDLDKASLTYHDHEDIGEWSRVYVKQATELAIVGGYPDGTFRPANSITRAEAAKILYTFMHYAGLL